MDPLISTTPWAYGLMLIVLVGWAWLARRRTD
jgi:uncharacterized protein (TIGR03382 family)